MNASAPIATTREMTRPPTTQASLRVRGFPATLSGTPSRTAIYGTDPSSVCVDVAGKREDRQIHRYEHDADHTADPDHHDGLEQARERRDGDVRLLLVEIRDLVQ